MGLEMRMAGFEKVVERVSVVSSSGAVLSSVP